MLAGAICYAQEKGEGQSEKTEQPKVEKKIDSHLLRAINTSSDNNNLRKSEDGRYLVDVFGAMSKDLLALIQSRGGEVVSSSEIAKTARVKIPLKEVVKVASDDRVTFVSPATPAAKNAQPSPVSPK